MPIRTYRPGDEEWQVAIYNEVAAAFPKFKPATHTEVKRRCLARDFDPATRFYVEEGSRVVGYATLQSNGRVSYPWCLPGHEHLAQPLLQHVLQAMQSRGIRRAFAAYRGDWPLVRDFFLSQGFHVAREMIGYILDLVDLPTPSVRTGNPFSPLERRDIPGILRLCPGALRLTTEAELERWFFHNPYFKAEALFVLRDRAGSQPLAVGYFLEEPTYANPNMLDANMPCFRLGAFGTEGMTTKRINGMFSLLTGENQSVNAIGLDMIGHLVNDLEKSDLSTLAGQVASDVPHLARFYQMHFRKQGSFPIWERELA